MRCLKHSPQRLVLLCNVVSLLPHRSPLTLSEPNISSLVMHRCTALNYHNSLYGHYIHHAQFAHFQMLEAFTHSVYSDCHVLVGGGGILGHHVVFGVFPSFSWCSFVFDCPLSLVCPTVLYRAVPYLLLFGLSNGLCGMFSFSFHILFIYLFFFQF